MKYINKSLSIERVKVQDIAKKFGTPTYCYSFGQLKENIDNFKKSFKSFSPLICFAVKSNTNITLIREIKKFGLGADVVSIGELMIALKAGINPKKIVFSGVGKTSNEINYAIDKKILLINAESESEISEIERIAKYKNKIVNIGIRLNPNIDAKTLKQISTGKKENKFGVDEKTFFKVVKYVGLSKNINLKCLSVHLGSQILDHKPYEKMLKVIDKIIKKSNHDFEFIDLGGGMGISYEKNTKKLNYQKYNIAIKKFLRNHNSKIIFEPGRSIVGNIGSLISKVIYIKGNEKKDFVILDAAMNDLMRPALYGANHRTIPVTKTNQTSKKTYEFVGPICESTDKFTTLKKFQKLKEKDLVLMCDVGAYGMSLSSNYNMRPKPTEILIKGSKINVIKKRQKLKDLI
ncbi:diaminopimelate decarboxylase [Candidatus Pelagibacter ubique]|uniref:Diaminopimelate decarboxylase n=1 Tax=Pelagibacter ubique TaxID=198252 RepID=A0ABX1T199_PELUQ|nr:diaminopimelate decarboxylase [Candidatus Pelagibacter ubique]NMN67224.1 diaminopimelate decarboxylase [Candidatus Pelagibacter ubique]